MLRQGGDVHGHATRSASEHALVGYRVPGEWGVALCGIKGAGTLKAFKRKSRDGFLWEYGVFVCGKT